MLFWLPWTWVPSLQIEKQSLSKYFKLEVLSSCVLLHSVSHCLLHSLKTPGGNPVRHGLNVMSSLSSHAFRLCMKRAWAWHTCGHSVQMSWDWSLLGLGLDGQSDCTLKQSQTLQLPPWIICCYLVLCYLMLLLLHSVKWLEGQLRCVCFCEVLISIP